MTPTQAISLKIAALVANGAELRDAFDAVLGQGAYEKLAGEIWEAAQQ